MLTRAALVVQAVKAFDIRTSQIHNDSTSIKFCGAYAQQDPKAVIYRYLAWCVVPDPPSSDSGATSAGYRMQVAGFIMSTDPGLLPCAPFLCAVSWYIGSLTAVL